MKNKQSEGQLEAKLIEIESGTVKMQKEQNCHPRMKLKVEQLKCRKNRNVIPEFYIQQKYPLYMKVK